MLLTVHGRLHTHVRVHAQLCGVGTRSRFRPTIVMMIIMITLIPHSDSATCPTISRCLNVPFQRTDVL